MLSSSNSTFLFKKRIRKDFSKIPNITEIPNLIQMQIDSYNDFLQSYNSGKGNSKRKNKGLEGIFRSIFPISDHEHNATLEYVSYRLGEPKYDVAECIQRGVNYAVPLMVTLQLILWEFNEVENKREVKGIKEQEVYMGEIPLMTKSGTFIINGAQRVIVSQMHRSPGVFYYHDFGKSNAAGKYLYSARVIPYRGSWLDLEFDTKDILFFRIDRKRKLPITTLFYALGYTRDQILATFYKFKIYEYKNKKWLTEFDPNYFTGTKPEKDIVDVNTGEILLKKDVRVTPRIIREIGESKKKRYYEVSVDDLNGKYIAKTITDNETGEIKIQSGAELTNDIIDYLTVDCKMNSIEVLDINNAKTFPYIRNTIMYDKQGTKSEALIEIYKVIRAGEVVTPETAEEVFKSTFFDHNRYDLSAVGRMKINIKHDLNVSEEETCLRTEDIIAFIKHLIALRDGEGEVDDIDSLSNRRIRSVGELIENQFRLGLIRIERSIVERINAVVVDNVKPHDLVNYKSLMSIINEFFGTSQLSQFMDQTNPLAEITHKRRVSALGPGGLTRSRAGFEVRDVHKTHYGKICPIETPEGQNIGLISSLATYATINKYGFLETPYRKVVNGEVTDEIHYLSAIEELKHNIAQVTAKLDKNKHFVDNLLNARKNGESALVSKDEIDYMDVSPKQLVSVAAALIPFLENDDANRALMGSNMQRQAVPLLKNEAPLIGTGMEVTVGQDSSAIIRARRGGIVERVDGTRIVIRAEENENGDIDSIGVDIYNLVKYQKSNQNTCINQRPIVKVGDKITKGDVIADGPSTDLSELALGRNVFVAFMPWNGYNFEDSILVSERIVRDDVFTSIHIEEFEAIARDTRLGQEEITRDIPNVSEEHLRYLDENGIIHIGAEVKAGDILVGKVTPKTESPLTPEEKLLRAIFGEKASEVRDSSLRLPPGVRGTVIDVRTFTRRGVSKSERALALERFAINKVTKNHDDQLKIISKYAYDKVRELLLGEVVESSGKKKEMTLKPKDKITADVLKKLDDYLLWDIKVANSATMKKIQSLKNCLDKEKVDLESALKKNIEKIKSGEDIPQGALKVVKVYVATMLKLQPGDKMAGRHGNKGVISKIMPVEDMPFMEDGTPIDIVLNPLGVPSRMNVGQIFETHMGWAVMKLGQKVAEALKEFKKGGKDLDFLRETLLDIYQKDERHDPQVTSLIKSMNKDELFELCENLKNGIPVATPVFDGIKEVDINRWLEKAKLNTSGQVKLIDGKTGEFFDREVTVGVMYMMKLDHLVDNKIHARSIGPYSLVTQQPLGGKSHFGGQRFGEMECWALEAYGAAYILQEMLTIKSDDVPGRIKVYESIVKGEHVFDYGTPESFNVMLKELQSLCLNIELLDDEADLANLSRKLREENNNLLGVNEVRLHNVSQQHGVEVLSPDKLSTDKKAKKGYSEEEISINEKIVKNDDFDNSIIDIINEETENTEKSEDVFDTEEDEEIDIVIDEEKANKVKEVSKRKSQKNNNNEVIDNSKNMKSTNANKKNSKTKASSKKIEK